MRNFQDTFETRKRSFINAFSICMTVPSTWLWKKIVFDGVSVATGNQSEASYTKTMVYHARNITFLECQELRHVKRSICVNSYRLWAANYFRETLCLMEVLTGSWMWLWGACILWLPICFASATNWVKNSTNFASTLDLYKYKELRATLPMYIMIDKDCYSKILSPWIWPLPLIMKRILLPP